MPIEVFAYCTHREPSVPDFPHDGLIVRDYSTPGFADHLIQVVTELFEGAGDSMDASLYAICRHFQRTNVLTSFSVDGEHIEAVAPWAWQCNAILKLPDRSIRDPNGAVLHDPNTGQPQPEAQIPYLADARQRKAQTEVVLRNRSVDTPETLPPVVSESEVTLRAPEDVAWRMLALFVVAVRAESISSGSPIPVDALQKRSPLAFQSLTPWEDQFLRSEQPSEEDLVAASWRYESLATLQWVTRLRSELPFPDTVCDVPQTAELMMQVPERQLIESTVLRETPELLDALDLNYRLLWAARDAAVNATAPPAGVEGGVITERQHALNWLTFFENADWDDVDIPS